MVEASRRAQTGPILRTFIAVELPEGVRAWIAGQQTQVVAALDEAGVSGAIRVTPPGNLHLTLRFLGDTTSEQCRRLASDLAAAAQDWRPLSLRLGALGCFPNCRQPNVVWLGVEGDVAELAGIQVVVERSVQKVGFAAETRPFSPHLTIGRAAKSASRPKIQLAGQAVGRLASTRPNAAPQFSVAQLVHVHSDLRPAGSIYTPLATFDFGRPA